EIRDYQRMGFVVAIAGGALGALCLAELSRRGLRRLTTASLCIVGLSTVVPAFSSQLPAYSPPALRSVYSWLAAPPDPIVIFAVPLPKRDAMESLDYLWAAARHKKALIHGFSGHLPPIDDTLRRESSSVYRADFFRALARLGGTHLIVHTTDLAALP